MTKLVDLDSLLFEMVNAAERIETHPEWTYTSKDVSGLLRAWVEYLSDDSSFEIKHIPVEDLEK